MAYHTHSNAVEILPGLWIGNRLSAFDLDFLTDKEIRCIINCTENVEFIEDKSIELQYRVSLPDKVAKSYVHQICQVFDSLVKIIRTHLRTHNILVHCTEGVQQSPAVMVAYLLKYAECDLETALTVISSKKPDVFQPKNVYLDSLISFAGGGAGTGTGT